MTRTAPDVTTEFAAEVRRRSGADPKQLQSKSLYRPAGSSSSMRSAGCPGIGSPARRSSPFRASLGDRRGDWRRRTATIVELGCGSGEKLMLLAETLQARRRVGEQFSLMTSSAGAEQTEQRLTRSRTLLGRWPSVYLLRWVSVARPGARR